MQTNTKYKIYQNKNITYINDTKYLTATYSKFASPSTLILFAVKTYTNDDSVDSRMAKLKLYSCKIWDGDNLIHEYIPVKASDGTIGLLDKVEKRYKFNEGTGNFIY